MWASVLLPRGTTFASAVRPQDVSEVPGDPGIIAGCEPVTEGKGPKRVGSIVLMLYSHGSSTLSAIPAYPEMYTYMLLCHYPFFWAARLREAGVMRIFERPSKQ